MRFGRKIGLAAANLFDATNPWHKPWTPDEFTSFNHGYQRLKAEIVAGMRTTNLSRSTTIPMQEQKLMVEAYHVYIEQCIKIWITIHSTY